MVAFGSTVCYGNSKDTSMTKAVLATTLPSASEAVLARETLQVLAGRSLDGPLQLAVLDDPAGRSLQIPSLAGQMLVRILEEMARGSSMALIPVHAELTTQEAAETLNISRPSLIQLLDEGKIEFRRVGTHRRVRFDALMAYKRRLESDRRAVLAELAAYDQELGI
jgi:excisionase family DNA binding protein